MKRSGKTRMMLIDAILNLQKNGYEPPYILVSNTSINIQGQKEILANVIDLQCPTGVCYLVPEDNSEEYISKEEIKKLKDEKEKEEK